jgi:8-oxo-dGTP pyrophosphatase MutT (NUDIX family)
MFIRIYFGDKPLFLCDAVDRDLQPYVHHDDAIFIDELDTHTVKAMIHEMQQDKIHAGVFYHPDLGELKKAFFKKFTLVVAAGGLVQNEKQEYLLIFRRGKWDLPKGKLDRKETLEDCALREIEEETGLQGARIGKPLTTTYHTYHEGARFILKESHWFSMKAKSGQELKPQVEEDITEIRWVPRQDLEKYKAGTYPAIRDVLGMK